MQRKLRGVGKAKRGHGKVIGYKDGGEVKGKGGGAGKIWLNDMPATLEKKAESPGESGGAHPLEGAEEMEKRGYGPVVNEVRKIVGSKKTEKAEDDKVRPWYKKSRYKGGGKK